MDKEIGLDMVFEHASVYFDGDDVVVGCSDGYFGNYLSRDEAIEAAKAILRHYGVALDD